MKKLLTVAVLIGATIGLQAADGTVNMRNRVTTAPTVDAPVLDVTGTPLSGAAYLAQLYAGTTADSLSPVAASTVAFANLGYFAKGKVFVPGIPEGTQGYFQVRAWEASGGDSYDAAVAAGKNHGFSNVFPVTTGGDTTSPPAPPANLVGLQGFSLVPEPTTFALGLFGGVALMMRRRR